MFDIFCFYFQASSIKENNQNQQESEAGSKSTPMQVFKSVVTETTLGGKTKTKLVLVSSPVMVRLIKIESICTIITRLKYMFIHGLFIYSTKACLRVKTPPRLGHLAPASEVARRHTLPFKKGIVCRF
jgi:hypothetical protein